MQKKFCFEVDVSVIKFIFVNRDEYYLFVCLRELGSISTASAAAKKICWQIMFNV